MSPTLQPSDTVNRDLPWISFSFLGLLAFFPCLFMGETYFHDDLLTYVNFDFGFLAHQLSLGHFPLWNPYLLGGMPFFANPNSLAAYPLLYPLLLFPMGYGTTVFFLIHWLIAAFGMFFFLHTLGMSKPSCRVGAITYAFSGLFWMELVHPWILATLAWIPWWLAFLDRLAWKGERRDAFLSGLAFSLLFLSCNYQMSLLALGGGLVYFGMKLIQTLRENGKNFPGLNLWLECAGFMLWGLVPAVLWLIPSGELILRSGRFQAVWDYAHLDKTLCLNPQGFQEFLFPENPLGNTAMGYGDYVDNAGFLGFFTPLLVLIGLWISPRRLWPWTLFALVGLGLALGPHLPIHQWACEYLPGFRYTRAPVRSLIYFVFSLCVLAAAGFEGLMARLGDRTRVNFFLQFVFLVSLLVPAWMSVPRGESSILQAPARVSFLSRLKETASFGRVWIPENIPYPLHWKGKTFLARYPVNAGLSVRLREAGGYDSLWLGSYAFARSLPSETFERLLAVQWRVFPAKVSGVEVEASPETHPSVWSAGRLESFQGIESLRQALNQKDFNPYLETLLNGPLPADWAGGNEGKISVQWSGREDGTDTESFQVSVPQPALVVFSEINYPGWRAELDGVSTPLYEADGLLRAVWVPAGNHEVRFNFHPDWVWTCSITALLWLLSLPFAWRAVTLKRNLR